MKRQHEKTEYPPERDRRDEVVRQVSQELRSNALRRKIAAIIPAALFGELVALNRERLHFDAASRVLALTQTPPIYLNTRGLRAWTHDLPDALHNVGFAVVHICF